MDDVLTLMAEAANWAPSLHNSQPWRFAITGDVLEIRADRSRATPAIDPRGRGLAIACGAAAFNAMVAGRAAGRACSPRLGRHGADEELVASVTVGGPISTAPQDISLAAAITRRHTMRGAFDPRPVPQPLVDQLRTAAEAEGTWLGVISWPEHTIDVAVLTDQAERQEQQDEHYRAELAQWLREPGVFSEDGIPADLVAPELGRGSDLPRRQFVGHPDNDDHSGNPPQVERPLLLLIGTDTDETTDWLRAGMALQHVWLALTAAGLAASPSTQAIDHDAPRTLLTRLLGYAGGHPQMLLRVGYPAAEQSTATAGTGRRPIADVLVQH
jgi:nitroreductase